MEILFRGTVTNEKRITINLKNKISILGLGWLGEPLAHSLRNDKFAVKGSTGSVERWEELNTNPFYVGRIKIEADKIIGDWDSLVKSADVLVVNFPPKRIENIETVYPQQIAQIIAHTPNDKKLIFISSTAVYGNTNTTVTELDSLPPEKKSGRALLKAEELLKSHFNNNVTILRFAGLIGPKRHPGKFLNDKRILKNPNVPVNLIHQEDCIGLIKTIIKQDCFGETINGCSDKHPLRKNYYSRAAKALHLHPPTFEDELVSSYKIIDNSKSKTLLKYQYQYPNPELIFEKKRMMPIGIVGGGPGNINLLTIEAANQIKQAEVILHDNLISEDILSLNLKAELIYVGRKYGDSSNQKDRQDSINVLLEQYFYQGKKVIRLKSGDPYVYGRAAEEARFLSSKKIPYKVIPGISAALAAANSCNIPVTERNKSNALLICTAHTADYSFAQLKGIAEMLKAGNTLALYMGLKSLDKIIPQLMEVCQDGTIPINAISKVSRVDEVLLTSTLENIRQDLETNPLEMPVVFLIGAKPIAE